MEASTANGIRIVAIPGSVRPGNFTGKALEHLRSVCSHVGAIVLPGSVSVARVQDLFDEQGRCGDEATERRIRSVAHDPPRLHPEKHLPGGGARGDGASGLPVLGAGRGGVGGNRQRGAPRRLRRAASMAPAKIARAVRTTAPPAASAR